VIQNELVTTAGNIIKDEIVRDVKESQFWAIMADETQDRAIASNWLSWFDMCQQQKDRFRSVKSL